MGDRVRQAVLRNSTGGGSVTVPAGSTCKIRYAWKGKPEKHPRDGDVIKTRSGRRYVILRAHGQRIEGGAKMSGADYGMHGKVTELLGPMNLEVLVMGTDDPTPRGAKVFDMKWDKREKKCSNR